MLDINKMLINKVQTKYIDALENYKNATQILVKYNNIIWLIFLNVQLGSIYLDTNYYKQAYEYFIEARKSAKEFHSDWLIKYTDYNIADYYLKVDEPEKAVKICKNYIEVENKKHTDLRLLYIFICGLFKLGRYSECVEYISQINRCKLNEEECIFFDLISKMSANYDPEALKEKCDIFIQRLTELSNAGDVNKFVLLISDYFFDHGEFKLA